MHRYAITEAPSALGHIPDHVGVARTPEVLLSFGLAEQPVPEGFFTLDRERHAKDDIYIAGADGSHPHKIIHDGEAPAWSPDGTRIAFERFGSFSKNDSSSGCKGCFYMWNGELVVAHADGTTST